MISKLHTAARVTHTPRVHKAMPPEPAPLDQVRLSGGPVTLSAGRLAAQSAAPGAVGPVIAKELEELGVTFLRDKHFRLPFTAEKKTIDAREAARILNGPNASSLSVDRGRGAEPLTSLEHLAVLQRVQEAPTQRPLDKAGSIVTGFTRFSDAKGARMDVYTAYLELVEARPVVALESEIPVGTIDPQALQMPSVSSVQSMAARLASDRPLPALRQLVSHLRTFRDDDAEAVRADLGAFPTEGVNEAGRELFQVVKASSCPPDDLEAVLARLEPLPLEPAQAGGLLKAWGLDSSRSAKLILEALDILQARPEAVVQLTSLGDKWRSSAYYYSSEVSAALKALAAGVRGQPYDQQAITSMVARSSSYGSKNAVAAYETATASKMGPLEALEQIHRIDRLSHSSGLGQYAQPVLYQCYADHPEAYPLLEKLAPLKIQDLGSVLATLKGLPEDQATGAARRLLVEGPECLRREGIAGRAVEGFAREMAAGAPFEQALSRLERLGEALQKGGAGYDYHKPLLSAYPELLAGRSDSDPVRLLAEEMASQRLFGQTETKMLEAVAAAEKVPEAAELVRTVVLSGRFKSGEPGLALTEAALADLGAGNSVETVRERLEPLLEGMAGSYESYVTPVLRAYRDGLAGGPELEPGRELLGVLVERKLLGDTGASALKAALEPAGSTSLTERTGALKTLGLDGPRAFASHGPREAAMGAWRALVKAGDSVEKATERLLALGQTLDARGQNYPGHVTPFLNGYAETVTGEEGQAFALDLVGRNLVGEPGASALRSALGPAEGLDTGERTEAFRRLCLEGPKPFNRDGVREATWEAFCAELAVGTPAERAHQRLQELGTALEEKNLNYTDYIKPMAEAYGRHLAGGPELDPGRAFLLQLVGRGLYGQEGADCLAAVAPPIGKTTLEQRVEAFRELCLEGPKVFNAGGIRKDVMQAYRAEVGAGTSPERARERLLALGTAMDAAGINYTQYAQPLVQLYRDKLAGDESLDPARRLLLDAVEQRIYGEEGAGVVRLALEPWEQVDLADRVALVRELTVTGPAPLRKVREQVLSAARAELEAGTPRDRTVERLTRLGQSLEKSSINWPDSIAPLLDGYAEYLAGSEDLEPLRVLMGELIAAGHGGDSGRRLIGAATGLAEVLPVEEAAAACRGLVLETRTAAPAATLRALRVELEHGLDQRGAQVRMSDVLAAAERGGYTYSRNQESLVDLYAQHVAGGPDGAVRTMVELMDRGASMSDLEAQLPDLMVMLKRLTRSGLTALEFEALIDAALSEVPPEERWNALLVRVKTAAELKLASLAPEPGGIEYDEDEVWVGDFNLPTN